MSKIMSKNTSTLFTILTLTLLLTGKSERFSRNLSQSSLGLKKEKLTHLHFYFHETIIGKSPTAYKVAESAATNTSATLFGIVTVMDDPLTLDHDPTSKIVGRSQGFYASADLTQAGLFMAFTFVFGEGKYNGSSLSLLGRNGIFLPVREITIVGGSGYFRFARGYVHAKTYSFDLKTGNNVIECNVYALHY